KITNFIGEVKLELTKVSWSSRKELIGASMVVIAITVIMAVYVGAIDLGLSRLLTFLIR
ncbi:preprotein translocase subunit SecE, partial [bacterium]